MRLTLQQRALYDKYLENPPFGTGTPLHDAYDWGFRHPFASPNAVRCGVPQSLQRAAFLAGQKNAKRPVRCK